MGPPAYKNDEMETNKIISFVDCWIVFCDFDYNVFRGENWLFSLNKRNLRNFDEWNSLSTMFETQS